MLNSPRALIESRAYQKTEFRPPGDLRHFFTIFNYSDVETRSSVPDGGRIFINNPGQTAPNRIKMEKFIGKRASGAHRGHLYGSRALISDRGHVGTPPRQSAASAFPRADVVPRRRNFSGARTTRIPNWGPT
ncbi:hypothetical protein GEV33_014388 [Tenebrio molitor]|uniref:Uncharacterized protein n=1 Tax=Tenebrio molitor TaxID=7067 RepID=A0A8J6L1U0_TENMO|nr:hypothetical protein GEV33_014388 [Tenebrio molitor]